jgi:hypothetical protein
MTLGEITRFIKGYIHREEREARFRASMDYALATTICSGISSIFGGGHMPEIHEVYPSLFEEKNKTSQSVANFINFANDFNRRFKGKKNDSRTTESNN